MNTPILFKKQIVKKDLPDIFLCVKSATYDFLASNSKENIKKLDLFFSEPPSLSEKNKAA